MTRQQRAAALLGQLRGPVHAGPQDLVFLSSDEPAGLLIPWQNRPAFLRRLGLADLEREIRAEVSRRPDARAVLVVVGAWARLDFAAPCACRCAA